MIRPSALSLARHCSGSAELAERYPNTSDAAIRGTAIHAEIARWISDGEKPRSVEVLALASAWSPPDDAMVEVETKLEDPATGNLLTRGTADCAWVDGDVLHVVDWKTGQSDGVDEADLNMQLAAYGAALALARGLDAYRAGLCFVRPGGPTWQWGETVRGAAMWKPIEEIAAIVDKPKAFTTGPHCQRCYSRLRCEAFLLPAVVSRDTALAPTTEAGIVAAERVAEVHLAATAMYELAERAKDWVRAQVAAHQGAIRVGDRELALVQQAGRRSVSVSDVEAAGRADLVKTGAPIQSLRWRNVKPHERKAG